MFSPFERMMAWRYLRARRGDGFISLTAGLSLVGITLGVAILIIVMSVMNGFREELLDKILGFNAHAGIWGYGGQVIEYEPLADELLAIDGVVRVTPLIFKQVLAMNGSFSTGAFVRGIEAADLESYKLIKDNVVAGSMENFEAIDIVAMGEQLAQTMGVQVGDFVTVLSPEGVATPFGTAPRTGLFELVATFNVGLYEYDNAFLYMPMVAAQSFFRMGDSVTLLDVFVEDPLNIRNYIGPLQEKTAEIGVVRNWEDQNREFFLALQVERNVMFVILVFIILIAAFNIISSLIMLVKDKAREIAILRTMGVTQSSIMRIFMLIGTSVGVAGTMIGFTLGTLFVMNIGAMEDFLENRLGLEIWNPEVRLLAEVPAAMSTSEVAATLAIALLLSFLATIFPARRAAHLDPVEVLRHE